MRISFLLAFLFLLTIEVFGQNSKYNTTDILNVRAGAGVNYAVVGQLSKGEKVTIISESNGWTEITTQNGLKGYVSTNFLGISATSNNTKVTEPSFFISFCTFFVISFLIMRWLNKPTKKKDGRTASGYRITNSGLNYSTTKILIISFFIGIIAAFLAVFGKKDTTSSISEKSNPTEIPKIEEKQVVQEPQNTNSNHGWKTFKHKYGFSIELPDYFSEGILTNDATQSYTDELIEDTMNKSHITVETIGEGSQASLATAYKSTLESSENVVYKVLQNNWFVITGQDVNGIYYLKTMVKNGQTHYLSVRYPVSQKERFDKILPRIANSFQ